MGVLLPSFVLMAILGLAAGLFLIYFSRKFAVEVDPRVQRISEILPQANCGACGAPGCSHFAEGVVRGEYPVTGCVVGGTETANEIAKILGIEAGEVVPRVAVVRCVGDREKAPRRAEYDGIEDCKAAHILGGDKGCEYGCLGMGSCVRVCPFDAIKMGEKGLPVVNEDKCTGCGKCAEVCPRSIIEIIPRTQKIYLACMSLEKAKDVMSVCSVGCIGCGLCARVAPEGVVEMQEGLPILHYDKVSSPDELQEMVEKCPKKSFIVRE